MYVPNTKKIISSYDVVFDESFSSTLSYTSQYYSEAMDMRPAVSYVTCATYSREQTGNIITFAQFEEGIYDLKLVTIQKEVTNLITIQLCHH